MIRKTSFLLLFLLPLVLMANKSRQALKALEEGDYNKAIYYLEKSVERDSLNPNTEYVYARLYITDSFPAYDIDIAHNYALRSIKFLEYKTEDHIKEMERSSLEEEDFFELKQSIDALAFRRARKKNTELGYEKFMEVYPDAVESKEALKLRNSLAFDRVAALNTWQSYESFFKKYHEAEQAKEARDRFERLVYLAKTKSGEVEDLEDFLIEYPDTPYRSEIERRIFNEKIALLDDLLIYDFINRHHNSSLTKQAFDILYHLGLLEKSKLKNFNLQALKVFEDSVRKIENLNEEVLFPTFQGHYYNFLDLNGAELPGLQFHEIDERYFCGKIEDELLAVKTNQTRKLINRQGNSIYIGEFENFTDAGDGIIIIKKDGKYGAVHASGFEILPFEYSELKWVGHKFFAGAKGEYMGLYDFGGRTYAEPVYDDIYLMNSYWIFEKNERLVVMNFEEMRKPMSINFEESFEEVELIDSTYLIAFDDDLEVLFNEKLEKLAPPSTQRINTRLDTWVFQKPTGYQIFDKKTGEVSEVVYEEILQNAEWLGLKRNEKWEVRGMNLADDPILGIDSLKLIGEDIAIIFRENEGMAIFPNKKIVHIKKGEFLTSIGDPARSNSHFLIVRRDGKNILYRDGVLLFETDYQKIDYIADDVFLVKEKGKYGAVDQNGRLIMRVRYDAIGRAENGMSSVILNGKFGGYNFTDRILLALDFDEKFSPYDEHLFVVQQEALAGLMNDKNQMIVPAEFDEIAHWSDSTFLGKEDGKWLLLSMKGQNEILTNIVAYEYVKDSEIEKIIKFQSEKGWGIYHSELGIIIPPVYNDIYNLGSEEQPLFFAEHSFSEANYYVVVYYDAKGQKIKTAGYAEQQFLKIVCD